MTESSNHSVQLSSRRKISLRMNEHIYQNNSLHGGCNEMWSSSSMVTSIIEGSAEGDMKTIPCSAYPDMNLESPRTQSLAVLNYARLAFKKHHEQKYRILPDSLGSHVVQSIVSFNMFKQIADVAWIPQDEQLNKLLRTAPRFSRYLRLVEPPKRMRLEVGTEGIKDSFSKLLAGEGMLASLFNLIVQLGPSASIILICITGRSPTASLSFSISHREAIIPSGFGVEVMMGVLTMGGLRFILWVQQLPASLIKGILETELEIKDRMELHISMHTQMKKLLKLMMMIFRLQNRAILPKTPSAL
ncbi:hypothetical protein LENED_009573 [Lentinula edodes]|uniref:Uncharacterized protein n=1 Tax=Lentinula edodes TaxID=5353 RepID=A0A1Q3EK37_LENED|nr:hypothetical protein LENED_009573 [Lentinula edodes]